MSNLMLPIYAINGKIAGFHVINADRLYEIENVPRYFINIIFHQMIKGIP